MDAVASEEEEEEGSLEVSAVPTPTLHLPSLSPAGVAVKAKVRAVVPSHCSLSPLLLIHALYQQTVPEVNSAEDKLAFLGSVKFTSINSSFLLACKGTTPFKKPTFNYYSVLWVTPAIVPH